MKKLLKGIIIALVIIVIAVLFTGCRKNVENEGKTLGGEKTNESKSKTYEVFNKIFSGDNYMLVMEDNMDLGEGEEKTKITMAQKGSDSYIDVDAESQHSAIIYKNNKTYIIVHDEKIFMTSDGDNTDTDLELLINQEDLEEIEESVFTTGKESIEEKEYDYEEYIREDGVIYRYYFEGNDLKYLKATIDGVEKLVKILEISLSVDDSIFDLPNGYEEMNINALQ